MSAPAPANRREEYSTGPTIQDWAHIVSFHPRLYLRPQSLDELKGFLQAAQGGLKVRGLGNGSLRERESFVKAAGGEACVVRRHALPDVALVRLQLAD